MSNPFNNVPFTNVTGGQDLMQIAQQAMQNPQAFEENLKRSNPMAYQQAMNIKNSANPQAIIMQMAQARGVNPNVLRMLGIK